MINKAQHESKVEVKVEQRKGVNLMDSLRPKPGHKLFKFSKGILAEVQEWEYETAEIEVVGSGELRRSRRLIVQPETSYLSCLNKRNAIKKLNRNGFRVDGFLNYSYADRN